MGAARMFGAVVSKPKIGGGHGCLGSGADKTRAGQSGTERNGGKWRVFFLFCSHFGLCLEATSPLFLVMPLAATGWVMHPYPWPWPYIIILRCTIPGSSDLIPDRRSGPGLRAAEHSLRRMLAITTDPRRLSLCLLAVATAREKK